MGNCNRQQLINYKTAVHSFDLKRTAQCISERCTAVLSTPRSPTIDPSSCHAPGSSVTIGLGWSTDIRALVLTPHHDATSSVAAGPLETLQQLLT